MKVIADTFKTLGAVMVLIFFLNGVVSGLDASLGVNSEKAAHIDAALTK